MQAEDVNLVADLNNIEADEFRRVFSDRQFEACACLQRPCRQRAGLAHFRFNAGEQIPVVGYGQAFDALIVGDGELPVRECAVHAPAERDAARRRAAGADIVSQHARIAFERYKRQTIANGQSLRIGRDLGGKRFALAIAHRRDAQRGRRQPVILQVDPDEVAHVADRDEVAVVETIDAGEAAEAFVVAGEVIARDKTQAADRCAHRVDRLQGHRLRFQPDCFRLDRLDACRA